MSAKNGNDDVMDRLFGVENYRTWERKQWDAGRFHRAADRHDRRIPFETRVAVLQRANEHCERCGRFIPTGFTPCLELHHLTYERAYHAEVPEDLMALCRDCHQQAHGL
jgi:5-methylcytosine-specific restriction endonuclease McrA